MCATRDVPLFLKSGNPELCDTFRFLPFRSCWSISLWSLVTLTNVLSQFPAPNPGGRKAIQDLTKN